MKEPVFSQDQENRIKELMHASLSEFFESKGNTAKSILVGTAVVVGALTVIFGGFKAILGWLGFHYISTK